MTSRSVASSNVRTSPPWIKGLLARTHSARWASSSAGERTLSPCEHNGTTDRQYHDHEYNVMYRHRPINELVPGLSAFTCTVRTDDQVVCARKEARLRESVPPFVVVDVAQHGVPA